MIAAIVVVGILAAGIAILSWYSDIRCWNKGYCACGRAWKYFDTDSQGGRGYICPDCHEIIWLSWIFPEEQK